MLPKYFKILWLSCFPTHTAEEAIVFIFNRMAVLDALENIGEKGGWEGVKECWRGEWGIIHSHIPPSVGHRPIFTYK